jgi:hypothetical protein
MEETVIEEIVVTFLVWLDTAELSSYVILQA